MALSSQHALAKFATGGLEEERLRCAIGELDIDTRGLRPETGTM